MCLKRVNLKPSTTTNKGKSEPSTIFENWCILPQTLHQCSPLRTVPSLGRRRFSAQKALQSFPVSLLYSRFLSLAWSPRNGRICFAFHFSPCPAFFSLFPREFDFLGMFSFFRVSPSPFVCSGILFAYPFEFFPVGRSNFRCLPLAFKLSSYKLI